MHCEWESRHVTVLASFLSPKSLTRVQDQASVLSRCCWRPSGLGSPSQGKGLVVSPPGSA